MNNGILTSGYAPVDMPKPLLGNPTPVPVPGGRVGWSPAAISGLYLWLDASDESTVTLNGGNVSQWRDKSPGVRHFAQSTASAQPAYTRFGENRQNVLTFDGSRRLVSSSESTEWSFLHDGTLNYAIYVVSRATGTTNVIRTIMTTGDSGRGTFRSFYLWHDFGQIAANNVRTESIALGGSGFICTQNLGGQTTNVLRAFEVIGDLRNATNAQRLRLTNNNSAVSVPTAGSADPSSGAPQFTLTLGSLSSSSASLGMVGTLCEILMIARVSPIAAYERNQVFSYLVSKWRMA